MIGERAVDTLENSRVAHLGRCGLLTRFELVERVEGLIATQPRWRVRTDQWLKSSPDARLPVDKGSVAVKCQYRIVGHPTAEQVAQREDRLQFERSEALLCLLCELIMENSVCGLSRPCLARRFSGSASMN